MRNRILSIAVMLLCAQAIEAKVELPGIIGSGMVLQRNTETELWGKATAGKEVRIRTSWDRKTTSAKAGADGKWEASISTPEAGGPYTIEFNDGEKTVIDNIMIGDVWFCSGQSNMEMPMKGFSTQPVEGAADVIATASPDTPIRICQVSRKTSLVPQEECQAIWKTNNPEAVANTSATAYYFARKVQEVTGIPVGIIVSCWGGTPIQAWMDRETMEKFPEFDLSFISRGEMPERAQNAPTTLFNAMVAPLTGFSVKGFLWYQGEANRTRAAQYRKLQPAYVEMMRNYWDNGELPFYYVQIAPYVYEGNDKATAAELREAQMQNLEEIPNSGMVVTMDIGDEFCIHPARKEEVGTRLAYMALVRDYGLKGIDPFSPTYESWRVENGKIIVKFKVGSQGLAPLGQTLEGFEVAGNDRVFHPAVAKILRNEGGKTIEVICPEVKEPAAVRYGFRNVAGASLYNCFGIPASPFRTDDWK